MKCEYCFEPFDLDDRIPLKLQCSHLFCKECVENLEYTLTYCPIDYQKIDYKLVESDKETLHKLNFTCPEHHSFCIGVCFDHNSAICNLCKDSHSTCNFFKGSQNEISKYILKKIETACSNYSNFVKQYNKSIFTNNDLLINVEKQIRTLDTLCEKFERNELNQQQKDNFLQDIRFVNKVKIERNELNQEQKNNVLQDVKFDNKIKFESNESNQEQEENLFNIKNFCEKIIKFYPENKVKILEDCLQNKSAEEIQNLFIISLEKISIVLKELESVNNPLISLFQNIEVNTQEISEYVCNFRMLPKEDIVFNGCGIGLPCEESSSIYVSCFEIIINDEKYSQDIGIVEFVPNQICSKILFDRYLLLPQNANMIIHIVIEGKNNYLFKAVNELFVSAQDINGHFFMGWFPILYLFRNE